jgi:HJR/Mrr/RecB family endonuclease
MSPQHQELQKLNRIFEGLGEENTSTAIRALDFAKERIAHYYYDHASKVDGGASSSIGHAVRDEGYKLQQHLDEIASFLRTPMKRGEPIEGDKYEHVTSAIRSAADIYLHELRSSKERTQSDVIEKLILQAQDLLNVQSIAAATPGLFDKYYSQQPPDFNTVAPSTGLATEPSVTQFQKLGDKEFEEFVANILRKMGFNARVVGGSRDHNVDIIASKTDEFGYLEQWVVQCKKYADENKVTGPMVLSLATAAAAEHNHSSACFVTSSDFTEDARDRAKHHQVRLVNGRKLLELARCPEQTMSRLD